MNKETTLNYSITKIFIIFRYTLMIKIVLTMKKVLRNSEWFSQQMVSLFVCEKQKTSTRKTPKCSQGLLQNNKITLIIE